MTKQEKINAIYEKIADKTLSFGCRVIFRENIKKEYLPYESIMVDDRKNYDWWVLFTDILNKYIDKKIIWHPVMIWDVLDYLKWQPEYYNIWYWWKNKRKPIEDQSDKCIDYIYNLISENDKTR